MDIKKITKVKQNKTMSISIRITKELSVWLKEKNYSPTAIFEEACKDLKNQK